MFVVDKENNQALPLCKKTFAELKFTERNHLQEWIDQDSSILGENLLIIQKEFDGFSDTWERLDLLALDGDGRLVLIENKLDDSGKDVVWKALKYVSYCASLSKSEIRDIYQRYLNRYKHGGDAGVLIAEFYECADFGEVEINTSDSDQRIILVAANFRKEVTSTVLWLQNHNVDIKCICVTPYQMGHDIFLDTEQILPPPSTEEYQVRLGLKKQEENAAREEATGRYHLRRTFWSSAIPQLAARTGIYQNLSTTKENWIVGASGHTGIGFNSVILLDGARAEVYIGTASKEENKKIFKALYSNKDKLEAEYGKSLTWDEGKTKASKVFISMEGISLSNQDDWPLVIDFLAENISALVKVFKNPLDEAYKALLYDQT